MDEMTPGRIIDLLDLLDLLDLPDLVALQPEGGHVRQTWSRSSPRAATSVRPGPRDLESLIPSIPGPGRAI